MEVMMGGGALLPAAAGWYINGDISTSSWQSSKDWQKSGGEEGNEINLGDSGRRVADKNGLRQDW